MAKRTRKPNPMPPGPDRRCRKCKKDGHATILWHWLHGYYCVLCIREMMGISADFVKGMAADAAGQEYPPHMRPEERGAE